MENIHLSEQERTAIRAYLARAEVRLSTLHRIATAFISGAGLLLLIPIFLRDVVEGLIHIYVDNLTMLPFANDLLNGLLFVSLAYPFLLSLVIPLYGVYLLLKDIIHFYYTIYAPGFSGSVHNPTFVLSSLMLAPDEAPIAKQAVYDVQYRHPNMEFMIPFSEGRRELYFERLAQSTEDEIIPESRRHIVSPHMNARDVRHMNTAFGLTRGLDRSLIEDVASTEMMLTRNILYLRRLMLRYTKTLLMFLWTAVISFVTLPVMEYSQLSDIWMLAVVYFLWAIAAMRIVRWPLVWIYRHRYGDVNPAHVDVQLNLMERRIMPWLWLSVLMGIVALALLIAARL